MDVISALSTASAPVASGTTRYFPRPMNSLRIFCVRICSTSKYVVRFTSCGMPTTRISVGRNEPRPAKEYPHPEEPNAPARVTTNRIFRTTLHDKGHQPSFGYDHLLHLLPCEMRHDRGIGERQLLQLLFGRLGRHGEPAANLAIHLHRNNDFLGLRNSRVELRPRRVHQTVAMAEHFPQLLARMRCEGRQHADERLNGFADDGCRIRTNVIAIAERIQRVDQLHHRGHRGIELLSLLDVRGHPPDRVVRLASQRTLAAVER